MAFTPKRKLARKRVSHNAPPMPITTPISASAIPCPITMRRKWLACAPSAIRIPSSCVRCSTEYERMPYTPIAAINRPAAPKIVSSSMLNRWLAVLRDSSSSTVRMCAIGRPPLASRSAVVIDVTSACGSCVLRTTQ